MPTAMLGPAGGPPEPSGDRGAGAPGFGRKARGLRHAGRPLRAGGRGPAVAPGTGPRRGLHPGGPGARTETDALAARAIQQADAA